MRWKRPQGSEVHLAYCTNVHPAESFAEVLAGIRDVTFPLKQRISPAAPFALGLYLSAGAVDELLSDEAKMQALREVLAEGDLYVPSLNAFPIGGFHDEQVKERAFRPAWNERERREYTVKCVRALAALLPDDVQGAISTHTGGLKDWGAGPNEIRKMHDGMITATAPMQTVFEETGKRMALALEPEPFATFETVEETEEFLRTVVFRSAPDIFVRELGMTVPEAGEIMPDRIGLCLDACHAAVQYEDVDAVRAAIQRGRMRVHKMQVSSALELKDPRRNRSGFAKLREFVEPRWFHQVVGRGKNGKLRREADLEPFLNQGPGFFWKRLDSWRVHFHVPVFVESIGPLGTTRHELEPMLRAALQEGWTDLYEIETYTFDKLPAGALGDVAVGDLVGCLEREYRWVISVFESAGLSRA